MKLVRWEQLAAQGVPRGQVHKRVAGGSQSVEPAQGFGIQSADRLWKDRLFASDRTGICLFKSQGADYGHRLYQCAGHVPGTFSG